jgi:hypothetical protein
MSRTDFMIHTEETSQEEKDDNHQYIFHNQYKNSKYPAFQMCCHKPGLVGDNPHQLA